MNLNNEIVMWALILLSSTFSLINLILFFKILKKQDDFELKMLEYIKETDTNRFYEEQFLKKISKDVTFLKNKVLSNREKKTNTD